MRKRIVTRKGFCWPILSALLLFSFMVAQSVVAQPAEISPEAKMQNAKKYVKDGDDYYQKADFNRALLYYEKALAIDSSNTEVADKIEECKRMQTAKETLRAQLPGDPKQRESVLETKYGKAKALYKQGNLPEAREEFQQIWIVNGNKKARKYVERIDKKLAAREEKAQAEQEAQRKKTITEYIKQGKKSLGQDKYQQALAEFNKVLLIDPQNAEAKKYVEETKELMEKKAREIAEEQKEEKISSLLREAKQQYNQDNYSQAIALCNEILEIDPANKSANSLLETAKEKQAEAEEEKAEELIERHISQGINLYKQDKLEAARAEFNEVLRLDAANSQALEYLDKISQAMQEKEAGEKQREEEITRLIKDGEALLAQKKFAAAIAKFEQILELENDNVRAKELMTQAQSGLEAEKRAEQVAEEEEKKEVEIEKIEKEMLEKATALSEDGIKLYQRERYEEALAKFQEALEIEPLFAKALEYKKLTEAKIAGIEQARAAKAKASSLMEEAGRLYKQKMYDQALAKAKEAEETYPELKGIAELRRDITKAKSEQQKTEADQLIREANDLYDRGKYEDALAKYQEAQKLQPENTKIAQYISRCSKAIEREKESLAMKVEKEKVEKSQELFKDGLEAYKKKDLEQAVQKWQEALALNPDNVQAKTYLEQTKEAYEEQMQAKAKEQELQVKEAEAQKKMETLVSIATKEPTSLTNFLSLLSLITDIDFYIAPGVEANVQGRFEDKPLREILDTVLKPIGLKWSRRPGTDMLVISPDLQTKVFNLTPTELAKVKALKERGVIQRLLWGEAAEPVVKGVELTLDDRESILILTDSQKNIDVLTSFLRDLKVEAPPEMVYRSYQVPAQDAPKIKALLEAMLGVKKREAYTPEEWAQVAPYERQRKILISDGELIIYDTPRNLATAEEILTDKGFIGKITERELEIRVFDIAPKQALEQNPEELKRFGLRIKDIIETKLYAKVGKLKAEEEGRRLWFDPYAMQLTIVDYPDNIKDVEDFIQSLPQIERKERSEIVFLKHASASDMAEKLQTILGIAPPEVPGVERGITATKSLRVEGEFEFRDLHLRLVRVNENDVNDELDDSAEFIVRTPTTSQDITIEEYRSEFIDQYEIVADDIRPSGTPGEGRVRVMVRYLGPTTQAVATPLPEEVTAEEERRKEEVGISIDVIDDLNAILIRYTDPTRYTEVRDWIEQLDIPVKQVSIETKFVEVMESRAKEVSSELTVTDLTEGIDLDQSILNMRFAQYADEFRSPLEPAIETPGSANLLKGTTIFNWILLGGDSPINYQLRLLEAEGLINVVSGPHVTVVNGETAEFYISKRWQWTWDPGESPLVLDQVELDVTPNITQLDHITLEIDAIIEDFDSNIGEVAALSPSPSVRYWYTTGAGPAPTAPDYPQGARPWPAPVAVYQGFMRQAIISKDITTVARIEDGQTIVLGGWMGERSGRYSSGVPVLRNLPYIGKILFSRNLDSIEKTTLLIFLTGRIVE